MAFGDSVGLLFKIRADSDQAQAELKKFRKAIDDESKSVLTLRDRFFQLGQSAGLSTAQMTSVAKAAPVAGAAIAGIGAATIGAGAALFQFAKNASEAGSEIFDLKAKTGLGAESLSALKFAAEQSGSSIQEAAQAFVIYQNKLTDAAAANKTLFGIDAQRALQDQEYALRSLVSVLNGPLPQGYSRSSLAADLLGRSGANLLATFDTIGPSMDRFIAQAKRMGVVLSEEDVKAADEFGDTLTVLEAQMSAMANRMALQYAPAMADVMRQVGEFATQAQPALAASMKLVTAVIQEQANELRGWTALIIGAKAAAQGLDPGRAFITGMVGARPTAAGGTPGGAPGGGAPGLGGQSIADPDAQMNSYLKEVERIRVLREKEVEEARRAREKAAEEAAQLRERQREAEERAAQASVASLAAFYDHQNQIRAVREREATAIIERMARGRVDANEFETRAVLNNERAAFTERERQLRRLAEEARKANDPERVLEYTRALAVLQAEISEFNTNYLPRLTTATQADTIARLDNVSAVMKQAEALRQLQGLPAGPQGALPPGPNIPTDFRGQPMGIRVEEKTPGEFGPKPPDLSIWDQWKQAAMGSMSEVTAHGQIMHEAMTSVFAGVSQAAGSMVQAFLLGEKLSGKAFMAMAKGAIAAVAAEAAVRALFELAMGLASLWLNPAKAASHFAAAKVFGVVAAGAAAVSLAIPGGGNQGAGAGYGAATAAAGGSQNNYGEDSRTRYMREQAERDRYVTREDRRGPTVVQLIVDGKELGRAVLDDIRRGGDNRNGFKTALGVA